MPTKTAGRKPHPDPVTLGNHEPSLQGIAKSVDDLELDGHNYSAEVDAELTEGKLMRTMSGASTVELSIEDPGHKLLQSPLLQKYHEVDLDGLRFSYVAAKLAGLAQPLGLTYEDRLVHHLRRFKGPVKAFREKLTRAEFIDKLRREAEKGFEPIPFVCPELHKKQPVKTPKASLRAKKEAPEARGGGIAAGAKVDVKGHQATPAQIEMGDRVLRAAESFSPTERVLEALIAACIDESEMTNVTGGTGTSSGILQVTSEHAGIDPMNVEQCVEIFLTKGFTDGVGAIAFANQNPNASAADIATHCQGNAAGASVYAPWVAEARKWIEAYGGGTGSSGTVTSLLKFAFEVKPRETYWAAMVRLAEEVQWALFVSDGVLYFIRETELVESKPRLLVRDGKVGIEDIAFDYDVGKLRNTVTVKARSSTWVAPPGSVALVEGLGPGDGRYLVEQITAPLRHGPALCEVELQRALKPLAEEAPKTKTLSGFGGSTGGAPKAIEAMIAEITALNGKFTYVWGGGHQDIKDRLTGYDCSGFLSHILYVGGLLKSPETSGALASMFEPGEGEWLTIYANAEHVFGKIKVPTTTAAKKPAVEGLSGTAAKSGFEWKYFQSGGGANSTGWVKAGAQDPLGGFSARHPQGL